MKLILRQQKIYSREFCYYYLMKSNFACGVDLKKCYLCDKLNYVNAN